MMKGVCNRVNLKMFIKIYCSRNLFWFSLLLLYAIGFSNQHVEACRVGSEKLKSYTKKTIERLLDSDQLELFYWPDEPLNEVNLSKVTELDITLAETRFNLDLDPTTTDAVQQSGGSTNGEMKLNSRHKLLRDIFVTCSADKDRSYTLTLNLELNNPFKVIDLHFKQNMFDSNNNTNGDKKAGLFRIRLPKSTLLVQLNQPIRYDECLDVSYIQLTPNLSYQIECLVCSDKQRDHLAHVFSKRMTQLDGELDSMLKEKLLLGLQTLLSQQRLDLELYLN